MFRGRIGVFVRRGKLGRMEEGGGGGWLVRRGASYVRGWRLLCDVLVVLVVGRP